MTRHEGAVEQSGGRHILVAFTRKLNREPYHCSPRLDIMRDSERGSVQVTHRKFQLFQSWRFDCQSGERHSANCVIPKTTFRNSILTRFFPGFPETRLTTPVLASDPLPTGFLDFATTTYQA